MDQMKYSSFIKKMAEDFATCQERVYWTHMMDAQHIFPATSMMKLITISEKINEMIMTKVA